MWSISEPASRTFPTPENIKRAAIEAIEKNFTKYTNTGGTEELKQTICDSHQADYGTSYNTKECIVTVGGKHAIFNLTQALINPGDEVIIPVPYWVTYKDVVNYAGGKCVFVNTNEQEGFHANRRHGRARHHAQDQDDHPQLAAESPQRYAIFDRGEIRSASSRWRKIAASG